MGGWFAFTFWQQMQYQTPDLPKSEAIGCKSQSFRAPEERAIMEMPIWFLVCMV